MEYDRSAQVIEAAWRWARQFWISARGFEAAVTVTGLEPVELILVRWRGWRRHVQVNQNLTESRVRNLQEPLDAVGVDPWGDISDSLAAATRQISLCRSCGGEKKVRCSVCQGSAQVRCSDCKGSGMTWSPRSRRMIGCRACRKSGSRTCPCYDGLAPCDRCGGKGKVEEWLEVVEEPFDRLRWEGSEVLAQAFRGIDKPGSFEESARTFSNLLDFAWKGQTVAEAPPRSRSEIGCGVSPFELCVSGRNAFRRFQFEFSVARSET